MPRYYIGGMPYGRGDGFYHSDTHYSVGGTFYGKSQELEHFGIKGMRWGQRRYQEEDGTLTAAGRRRYDVGQALGNAGRAISGYANSAGRAIGGAANYAGRAIGGATRSAGNAIGSAYRQYAPAVERTVRGYGAAAGQALNRAGEGLRTTASNIDSRLNLGFGARQNLDQAQSDRSKAQETYSRMENRYAQQRNKANNEYQNRQVAERTYGGAAERQQMQANEYNRRAAVQENQAGYNDRMANQSRAEMQRASSVALSSTAKRGEQAAYNFLSALNSATAYENAAAANRNQAASDRDMASRYAANAQAYNMLNRQVQLANSSYAQPGYDGTFNKEDPLYSADAERTQRHMQQQQNKINELNKTVDYWEQQYGDSVLGTVHKAIDNGLNWLKKLFGR